MTEQVLKVCGVALICAIAGLVTERMTGSAAAAIRIAGTAIAMGVGIVLLSEVISALTGSWVGDTAAEYASVLIRALGICLLCRICSDICRDCGAATLGTTVESVGKIALVLIGLPTLFEIVGYANELLEGL